MRIVLDTNVLVSGIFFGGAPERIFHAWQYGKVQLVISAEIYAEYEEVVERFAEDHPSIATDLPSVLERITLFAELCTPSPLEEQVSSDPDDDKFLACAVHTGVEIVVSGDSDLLDVSGYRGVRVLNPRKFCDEFLKEGMDQR